MKVSWCFQFGKIAVSEQPEPLHPMLLRGVDTARKYLCIYLTQSIYNNMISKIIPHCLNVQNVERKLLFLCFYLLYNILKKLCGRIFLQNQKKRTQMFDLIKERCRSLTFLVKYFLFCCARIALFNPVIQDLLLCMLLCMCFPGFTHLT